MKKFTFLLIAILIGYSGFSQEENTGYTEKTTELIKLTSGAQFDIVMQPMVEMVPEENQEAFKKELKESMEEMYEQMAVVYMESYTEEDVDAILAFYETPVGKKMVAETPNITQKSMNIGQEWGMKLQPIMMKYMD